MTNFILKVVAIIFFVLISIINLFSLAITKTVAAIMNVYNWIFASTPAVVEPVYLLNSPKHFEKETCQQ